MATYFHGNSEIGGAGAGDGLQTLILMNPAYVGYPDAQPPGNLVFLNSNNSNSSGNATPSFHHAPPSQPQHHFVGIPLQGGGGANSSSAASPQDPSQQDVPAGFLPRVQYNLYNLPIDLGAARDATPTQQGLSLSLSSQQPHGYVSFRPERDVPSQPPATTASPPRADDVRGPTGGSPSSASGVSNGVNGVQSVLLNSKYLKAAQELLDQVVNVGKGAKTATESSKSPKIDRPKNTGDPSAPVSSGDGQSGGGGGGDGSAKLGADLTTAERQEIQMKKAKLVNMLDEVEQRYRQYHHQMQIVMSWFEQAAGIGSARTYTALALKTISKQFRCLKDAILGQIRAANKSLGEDDALEGKIEGSSRLRYVDNQIRQQRALQQLGMIQHNAWRPQRGLPERSVSVLRAWLFEHFLHPYPKDSDKLMLAKQTGLTRSQVSNWFINARVRLWKPMVEEMYTEEMKEHDKNNETDDKTAGGKVEHTEDHSTSAKAVKSHCGDQSLVPKQDSHINQNNNAPASGTPTLRSIPGSSFNLIGSSEIESITQGSPKKLRGAGTGTNILDSPNSIPSMNMDSKQTRDTDNVSMKFDDERQARSRAGGFTLMGAPTNFIGGFGSYPIPDLGRFGAEQFQAPYSGNGVSLTLGLPHCENLSMSGAHQSFLPNQSMQLGRGLELGEADDFSGMNAPTNGHSTNVYENLNIQNRKSFAAQLLPDFVA